MKRAEENLLSVRLGWCCANKLLLAVLLLDLIIEFIDTQIGGNTDPPSPSMLWENC